MKHEFLESLKDYLVIFRLGKTLQTQKGKPMNGNIIARYEQRQKRKNTGQIYIYPLHVLRQMETKMLWFAGECTAAAEKFRAAAEHYDVFLEEGADAALEKYRESQNQNQ